MALDSLIQPIGQHKGVGLGMAIGMLSSLLSGAAYGTELGNMADGPKAGEDGHFFAAIDISAFEELEGFKARVDRIIDEVHGSRRREGVDRLLVPGEIEADFEADYGREATRRTRCLGRTGPALSSLGRVTTKAIPFGGWFTIGTAGRLVGHFHIHNGDDSGFVCERD